MPKWRHQPKKRNNDVQNHKTNKLSIQLVEGLRTNN